MSYNVPPGYKIVTSNFGSLSRLDGTQLI